MTEPIVAAAIGEFVAKSLLNALIKEEGYNRVAAWLKIRTTRSRLSRIISETIDEHANEFPHKSMSGPYPFWQSQVVIDELLKFALFERFEIDLDKAIKSNPRILPPTPQEVQSFYERFLKKANSDEKLKKLNWEENYKRRITQIYTNSGELLELHAKSFSLTERVVSQVDKLVTEQGYNPSVHFAALQANSDFAFTEQFELPREAVISDAIKTLGKGSWLHIYGGALSGKSILGKQVVKKMTSNPVFIRFGKSSANSNYFPIIYSRLSSALSHGSNARHEELLEAIRKLPRPFVIFFDDFPYSPQNEIEFEPVLGLIRELLNLGTLIVSTGDKAIITGWGSSSSEIKICQFETPKISTEELSQLISHFGCDEPEKWVEPVLEFSKGNIALACELVNELKNRGFSRDFDAFRSIVNFDINHDFRNRLFGVIWNSSLSDDSKTLLYRLTLPFQPISKEDIDFIANVVPPIKEPQKSLSSLLGRWVQRNDNWYDVSPLLIQMKIDDLGLDSRKSIFSHLAYRILAKKLINPIEAHEAFSYFEKGGELKMAAVVLLIALRDSLKTPEIMKDWGFQYSWLKFPGEIPIAMRIEIRLCQILLLSGNGESPILDSHLFELKNLVEETKFEVNSLGLAYIILAALLPRESANSYVLRALKEGTILRLTKLEINRIEPVDLVWLLASDASMTGNTDRFWEGFQCLPPVLQRNLQESPNAKVSSYVLASGLIKFHEQNQGTGGNWSSVIDSLLDLEVKARQEGLILIGTQAIRAQIVVWIEKIKDTKKGIDLFDKAIKEAESDFLKFLLVEAVGLSLFAVGDFIGAEDFLIKAFSFDESSSAPGIHLTYYAASRVMGEKNPEKSLEFILAAVRYKGLHEGDEILDGVKLRGEAAIALWKHNKIAESLEMLSSAFEDLVDIQEISDEQKIVIVCLSQCLNHVSSLVLGNAPQSFDGEAQQEPFRGMFFEGAFKGLLELYFPLRLFGASIVLAQSFEFLGNYGLAERWALKANKSSKDFTLNPFLPVLSLVYPYLIKGGEFGEALAVSIQIHEFCLRMNREEGLNLQNEHDLIKNLFKNQRKFGVVMYEELLLTQIIIPSIFFHLHSAKGNKDVAGQELYQLEVRLVAQLSTLGKLESFEPLFIIFKIFRDGELNAAKIRQLGLLDTGLLSKYWVFIGYILGAESLSVNDSVELQLAVVEFIEQQLRPLAKGAYIFFLLPYFTAFWKLRFETDPVLRKELNFWTTRSTPYFESGGWESKLKKLFQALRHHFDFRTTKSIENWLDN